MIRSDSELSPKQVLLKVSEEMDNSQQFLEQIVKNLSSYVGFYRATLC